MIGHLPQWSFLQAAAAQDALAHAYIFLGPRHVGKRHVADQFAALLLCHSDQAKPCGACVSCRALDKGIHQDYILLERAADEQTISIESMREFLGRLRQSPTLSARKVAIIDGAQDLSTAAANAFLKQLEEPTASTTMILVCHDQRRLLPTIQSRCQVMEFTRVATPAEDIAADPLWTVADGLPGKYLSFKRAPSLAQEQRDERSRFWELYTLTAGQRLALIDHFFKAKKIPHSQVKAEWDQRLLLWQQSLRDSLAKPQQRIHPARAVELYDQIQVIRQGLTQNINVRAHVEALLVTLT